MISPLMSPLSLSVALPSHSLGISLSTCFTPPLSLACFSMHTVFSVLLFSSEDNHIPEERQHMAGNALYVRANMRV